MPRVTGQVTTDVCPALHGRAPLWLCGVDAVSPAATILPSSTPRADSPLLAAPTPEDLGPPNPTTILSAPRYPEPSPPLPAGDLVRLSARFTSFFFKP